MKIRLFITLLAVAILGFSCSSEKHNLSHTDYLVTENLTYIEGFPESFTLDGAERLDLGLIGMTQLCLKDSLLIVSTSNKKGFLSFFNLENYENFGNYIYVGRAENEMTSPERISKQDLFVDDGELKCKLYCFYTGSLYDMNITKTLGNRKLEIEKQSLTLPKNLFSHLFLGDINSSFCRELAQPKWDAQHRYIVDNGTKSTTKTMELLNMATLKKQGNYNVISTGTYLSPDGKMVVEVPTSLNQIILYSMDDSFNKTICVGDELDKLSTIENRDKRDRIDGYNILSAFENFFGVSHIDMTKEEYHFTTDRTNTHTIQFFDWQGEPLCEVTVQHPFTSFDIDFKTKTLYTLSYDTDQIYTYDITELQNYLES